MTPERWQRIKELFDLVVDLAPSARQPLLDAAGERDSSLRRAVESLIAVEDQADARLRKPIFHAGEELIDDAFIGRQVGSYRIVSELGRGGMGAVYLAERADGQFVKQAAIKVVKRGMDTDEILRRFRYERQILAQLDHPNIARLLDGGTTEDGRPYFVMEFIEGLPIDQYCDQHKLGLTERLQLFLTVCSAVQHAHHLALSEHLLARLLHDRKDYVAAEPFYREALAIRRKSLNQDHPELASSLLCAGRHSRNLAD